MIASETQGAFCDCVSLCAGPHHMAEVSLLYRRPRPHHPHVQPPPRPLRPPPAPAHHRPPAPCTAWWAATRTIAAESVEPSPAHNSAKLPRPKPPNPLKIRNRRPSSSFCIETPRGRGAVGAREGAEVLRMRVREEENQEEDTSLSLFAYSTISNANFIQRKVSRLSILYSLFRGLLIKG